MHTKMPIGIEDFKEAREQYYVVDKTDFISRFIDNHAKVTLFTRPRRFGKTFTMSMLEYFFSIDKAVDGVTLFQDMAIGRDHPEKLVEQGKYPVIFMSLKGLQQNSWSQLYGAFTFLIQKEFLKYDYVWQSDVVKQAERTYCERIVAGTAQPFEYQVSLWQLTEFLSRYFKRNAIILLDEYDVPIQTAYTYGFYDEAMNFFKVWFNNTLKNNSFLHFAVLTGVLRVAKESIFSGLNNLDVYSVLNQEYGDVFGFTESEIRAMATALGYADKIEEIRKWYDGYRFGNTDIYNPWSVLKYVASACQPAPYWISTSDNGILQDLLRHVTPIQLELLQGLLKDQPLTTGLHETVAYGALGTDKSALYTMLLMTGYLTVNRPSVIGDERYSLQIPNEEIKRVYSNEILNTLVTGLTRNTFDDLFDFLLLGQVRQFEEQLQQILVQFVSVYDTANRESFYQGFMLGMIALFLHKGYVVESNRESGYGRFDIAIFPENYTQPGVILEFKVAGSASELDGKAHEAVQQIETKSYVAEFHKRQIQQVWKYGIAFCGKHVKIAKSV